MRFRLRTLLIVLAVLPPLLWFGWTKYAAWKAEQERLRFWLNLPNTPPTYLSPSQPRELPPNSSDLEHGKGP